MDVELLIKIIINKAIEVKRTLGQGFLESVYQNALVYELLDSGLKCEKEKLLNVYYKGKIVNYFRADIIVEDSVIVELKVADEICRAHEIQLVNYLTATGIDSGLILNFGTMPMGIKRKYRTTK